MHHLIFITSARYASVGTDYLAVSMQLFCCFHLAATPASCCCRQYCCAAVRELLQF
ncbi:hypothetical protein [Methanimicrococcus hacksteinii]|uniref:hypothetical protein n=1 Tax=Methanimicrococcus hacksteinii TaxID=3028293 RepID=UPI00298F1131|nr:hypothetical protein [Methanimicrococcus sp. At1]